MAIYSRSSKQSINNRRFWIWNNKCIIKVNNNQPDIGRIYLYGKDPYEAKYQMIWYDISKYDPKAFIESSNDMQDVYKNIEEYNLGKKHKISIVFDDMIADMINNKKT